MSRSPRRTRPYGRWTPEARRAFLERLAKTGNVSAAAAACGLSRQAAYDLRARDPDFARAWYNLGLALNGLQRPEEAIAALLKGEAADPRDPGIPYARATILAQLGRKMEAVMAVDRALAIAPGFQQAQQLRTMLGN